MRVMVGQTKRSADDFSKAEESTPKRPCLVSSNLMNTSERKVDARQLPSLKVAELKELCNVRGLKIGGRKDELVARLESRLKAEQALGENRYIEQDEQNKEELRSSRSMPKENHIPLDEEPASSVCLKNSISEDDALSTPAFDAARAIFYQRRREFETCGKRQQTELVSSLLPDARQAANEKDTSKLRRLLFRAATYVRTPRSGGDGGPGVSDEDIVETRTIKRALLTCLDSLDLYVMETHPFQTVAIDYLRTLLHGVHFEPGMKGVGQWIRIRDLVCHELKATDPERQQQRNVSFMECTKPSHEALQKRQTETEMEQMIKHFSNMDSGAQRRETIAGLLREARNSVNVFNAKALHGLLLKGAALLRPPRLGGDGGPGVSNEEMDEVRTLKRLLICCLESLDFSSNETQLACTVSLCRIWELAGSVGLDEGAKGWQQWERIKALTSEALRQCDINASRGTPTAANIVTVERTCHIFPGDSITKTFERVAPEKKSLQVCTDLWGVPPVVETLLARILARLGEATITDVIKTAWYDEDIWNDIDVDSLSRFPTMSWWTPGREPWENFLAQNIRHVCTSTGRRRGGARIWRLASAIDK